MNREKIKRLSKKIGVGRKVKCCLWFDGWEDNDDGTISCGHVGHAIPRTECPQCNGLDCSHTAKFIHIVIEEATPSEPSEGESP